MRRITYVSRFSDEFDHDEVEQIARFSAEKNEELEITGFLLFSDGVFFQVIEGEDDVISKLFSRIRDDARHYDVQCLENKSGPFAREFADWSMESIDLTESTDLLMKPIRVLMNTLAGTHGILEKYTQRSVLRFLEDGINPLTVPPESARRLVLFSDIMGFSSLASVLTPEQILDLVNRFVSVSATSLESHGGEIHKLIGDSVMASFPITAADDALEASLNLLDGLRAVREEASAGSPDSVLFGGVGIGAGRVVVGNVGTQSKLDYTLLGDAVNRASHLESLTRRLPRRLVFSEAVKDLTNQPWRFEPLGEFELKQATRITRAFSVDEPAARREEGDSADRVLIRRFVEGRS